VLASHSDGPKEIGTLFQTLTAGNQSANLRPVSLIRNLFWFLLFVFFTFCFVVLFEYGPSDFTTGFKKEFNRVAHFVQDSIHPGKKKPDQANP
jgi:hypothetical protein